MSTPTDFDVKERVRSATDIVDVIGRDLELRPQGRNFVARCPFHNDTKPSMTVNPARQSWKCWVCDIGGDVFSYVMQREGLDFPSALRSLAEAAGIDVPQFRRGPKTQPGQPNDRETLHAALELVARSYFDQLAEGQSDDAELARAYLESRGIDDETRQRFQIGFAPDSWDFATNRLRAEHYSDAVAVACGVVIDRQNGSGGYDRFRGRLMFPIWDASGNVISMGGRVIPDIAERNARQRNANNKSGSADAATGGAKYINGPETLLYRKSNELYGLNLARDAIRRDGEVFVMEGYTDVIAARMAGIHPVVAVLGTALTLNHVKALKRFVSRIVLVLDGDAAGRRRADEVLETFVQADADVRVMTLPDGADPADFLQRHDADAFRSLAASAPDAMDHKLASLTNGIDLNRDTHAATAAMETMLRVLAKAPTNSDTLMLKSDQMLVRLSKTFGLSTDRLQRRLDAIRQQAHQRDQFARKNQSRHDRPQTPAQEFAAGHSGDPFAEAAADDLAQFGLEPMHVSHASSQPLPLSGIDRQLFETLLESPDVAAMAVEAIDAQWLHSTTAKMLLSAYQTLDLQGHDLDAEHLLTLIENEHLKHEVVTLVERVERRRESESEALMDSPESRYAAILTRYHEQSFEAEKHKQIEKIRTAVLPEEEELAVLAQLFEAERIRQTPR
ncbi:MAG: DNA primase [Planctomycetota bacterium]